MRTSLLLKLSTSYGVFALALVGSAHVLAAQDIDDSDSPPLKITSITGLGLTPRQRPKVGKDVVTVLKEAGKYSTFLKLADQAGLTPILRGAERDSAPAEVAFRESAVGMSSADLKVLGGAPGQDQEALKQQVMDALVKYVPASMLLNDQITVVAPTDVAFKKLSKVVRDSIQSNPETLQKFLRGFIVNKGIDQISLSGVKEMQTMSGTTLPVEPVTAASPKIGGVTVIQTTYGDNGLIYGVDTVIRR